MDKYYKAAYWFGMLGGVCCTLGFLLLYILGKEPVSFTEMIGYILIPVFVFFGIKNFKDGVNGGELAFGQGMTVGFFVYSILALISAIAIFIFLHIDPVIFEEYKLSNLAFLEGKKNEIIEQLDEASYDTTFNNISHMTIFDVAFNDFLRKVIPGLFFSIIISIILKNSKT